MNPWTRRLAYLLCLVLALGFVAGLRGQAAASPVQQSGPIVCSWDDLPALARRGLYFSAAAYDSNENVAYTYGGVNQAGDVADTLAALDLSDTDPAQASSSEPSVSGARAQRYGAAGAFRPKGDDSAAFFIGGAEASGEGKFDLQMFDIDEDLWQKTNPPGGKQRVFAAAVYVPNHDIIVVQGGTKNCPLDEADQQSGDCEADNLGTQFLTFDPMTGDMRWENGPNGGPQNLFGSSLVYDSQAQRVLAFGGTRDNNLAENRVYSLDLSDPDLGQASWRSLNTSGLPPKARFFHSAAFDAQRNMMIVQGGVTQGAFAGNENVLADTWGLDLSTNPPSWSELEGNFRDLVGATMVYALRLQSPVLQGGRARFKDRSDNQTTFRDIHALDCRAAPTPTPEPTRPSTNPGQPKVCDYLGRRVPAAVINDAIANADNVRGFGEPLNPGLPPGPSNPLKTYLALQNEAIPYHPLFNGVIYKAGCP